MQISVFPIFEIPHSEIYAQFWQILSLNPQKM